MQHKTILPAPHDATLPMETALLHPGAEVYEAHADVAIDASGKIYGDGDLLLACFQHLLRNAIKFRPLMFLAQPASVLCSKTMSASSCLSTKELACRRISKKKCSECSTNCIPIALI
jgi:hypothetical protein